jgi:hypothetical protein
MMSAIMGLDASSSSSSDDGSSSSSNADLDPLVMIIMIIMPTPCLIERWMQHRDVMILTRSRCSRSPPAASPRGRRSTCRV